ncbi:MAG: hypothetical protein IPK95_07005 [Cellvibrionales bacterium]|nr:hypothetical protein [Cellvibrionales bacterium]
MDGHFSVVIDGVQHAFHTSRRAPLDRTQTHSGPFRVNVIEPMRKIRLHIAANETGIECDLVFHARSAPVREDKNLMSEGVRTIMNTTRFTQFGFWSGHFTINGQRTEVNMATIMAHAINRGVGVRSANPEAGAPGLLNGEPGVVRVWAPMHLMIATHYANISGSRRQTDTRRREHRAGLQR